MDKALFLAKAPGIMRQLMADFDLTANKTAAILGNIGHECNGFKTFQEQKPVAGGRGGFGWCQWTGPRRRAFESYVARNHLDPKSDKANYGWLFVELSSTEKGAIAALKNAAGLESEVKAFEASFERAGVKHYDSRIAWAKIALGEFSHSGPTLAPIPSPPPMRPPKTSGTVGVIAGGGLVAVIVGFLKWIGWF